MKTEPFLARNVAALRAYTPGEQPQDRGIVKLNTNENPYPPSPAVAAALAAFDASRLRLYPEPRNLALRRRVAAIHGCGEEQVFVGNGSDEILALATRAFVENDGAIGYFDPSYSLYPVLADIRGVPRLPVDLGPEFAWRMPPDAAAPLFLLTVPNAPTGIQYARADVAAFCRGFGGVVLLDEAYADFAADSFLDLALAPDNRNTLAMRTLSKSFSLAGLRLGYAVGPAPLVGALQKIKDSYNLDMLTQAVALAALGDLDHMRANVARIRGTRGRLAAALAAAGWKVLPSEANFLFARPPDGDAPGVFGRLKARGIFVRHFPGPRTGEYLRITIGSDEQIDRLLSSLAQR